MGWLRFATISSAPVIAHGPGDHVHVFALGPNQELRYFRLPKHGAQLRIPAAGYDGENLGGQLTSLPTAVVDHRRVQVFARGLDGGIYDTVSTDEGASWSTWRPRGGQWTSPPSAAVSLSSPRKLVVLGTGDDATVWALTSLDNGENFSLDRFAPGAITGDPTASPTFRNSSVCAFARFPDGVRVTSGEAWEPIGAWFHEHPEPVFASDPVVVASGFALSVAGRTPTKQLWLGGHDEQAGHRRGSTTAGSQILGKPAIAHGTRDFPNPVVVVARSLDRQLWGCRLPAGTSGSSVVWTPLGASATSDPAVADNSWIAPGGQGTDACIVVARDGDRLLYGNVSL